MTVYLASVDGVGDQDRADRRAFFWRDAAVAWAGGLARERFGHRGPVEGHPETLFGCVWTGWAGTRCRAWVDAVEVGVHLTG